MDKDFDGLPQADATREAISSSQIRKKYVIFDEIEKTGLQFLDQAECFCRLHAFVARGELFLA